MAERLRTSPIGASGIAAAIEMTRFPARADRDSANGSMEPKLVQAADLIGQLGDPMYSRKANALYAEFEENGMNRQLGYSSPADILDRYPSFFWNSVSMHIEDGIKYLNMTVSGRQWIANLHHHLLCAAHAHRFDDVGTAADRAVDHDPGAAGDGGSDFGQNVHGAAAVVELASAVIGDVDPLDPVIERDRRILRGRDPLDHQRYLVLVLDQFHCAPLQSLLEVAAGGSAAAGADVTLGDIALASAVMRGINGQAEGGVSAGDRSADLVFDEVVVAADIELKNAQRARRCLGDFLQARLGHRAQHMGGTESLGRARDACAGARIEDLERADRGQHDRQAQFAAEELDGGVHLGDIAQHARPECDLIECHAVAAHGGVGLGGSDNVVAGILIKL